MTEIHMISYWMGRPISEMSREELETEFTNAYMKIQELENKVRDLQVQNIRDLSAMGKELLHARRHWLLKLLGI